MLKLTFLVSELFLLILSVLLTDIVTINVDCEVLFLVRTYSGHISNTEIFNLNTLLSSLKKLQNPNWMALLLNTDKSPLNLDVSALDNRIVLLPLNSLKSYNEWIAGYDMTDLALDYLLETKAKARWIVITNGDNYYMPKSLNYISHPRKIDLFVVDFWSRYSSKDDILPIQMSNFSCHRARLKYGLVDLGGVIISYDRFQKEDRRFLYFGHINAQDGFMFQKMLSEGWNVHYIHKCLFSHSPNPYMCNKLGGIWWNSPKSRSELSNGCMNKEQASLKRNQSSIIELVSTSGINYWEAMEPEKTQNDKALNENNNQFAREFHSKLNYLRGNYCKKLQANKFQPDLTSYALLNHDLQSVFQNDQQYLDHFWSSGCIEMRAIRNAPTDYYSN